MSKFLYSLILILAFNCTLLYSANEKNSTVATKTNSAKPSQQSKQKTAASQQQPKVDFNKEMKKLENQRRKVQLKIYQLRVKLIREDSDLLLIHNEIMKLHKKLATELNNNEKMRGLLNQAQMIDSKIAEFIKTEKDKKKDRGSS